MNTQLFRFPPGYPVDDIRQIGERLRVSGGIVPGFIPGAEGPLSIQGLISAMHFEAWKILVLPDRNLASRIATIARDGRPGAEDPPTRLAIDLMAFCQAMDLEIEPSIAFHELAAIEGNEVAHQELAWFRASNRNQYRRWIDLAQGRRDAMDLGGPDQLDTQDLAFPLMRYRRNYIVALEIAALELSPAKPIDKMLKLLDWMYRDFIIAGPAAMLASFYFSPSREKRLFKQLRAPDRERAVRGVRNAAWDVTHMSDFVKRVDESERTRTRVLLATADKGLAAIAPLLMTTLEPNDDGQELLADRLEAWWPKAQAATLVKAIVDVLDRNDHPDRPAPSTSPTFIDDMIAKGEARLREWAP